jgi:hypothetical protein
MECQCVGGEAKFFRYVASGHAFRSGLNQQAENIEAVVLGERS